MEDHRDVHGLKKAIGLSMVWANISFLGCRYSSRVQAEVEYYPVPEENEIERWLKVHPDILEEDAAEGRGRQSVLGRRPRLEEEAPPTSKQAKGNPPDESGDLIPFETLTNQLGSFISMIRSKKEEQESTESEDKNSKNLITKNWNQSNNHGNTNNPTPSNHGNGSPTRSKDDVIKLLARVCSCTTCCHDDRSISVLNYMTGKTRLKLLFEFPEPQPFSPLSLYIGDSFMGNWSESSKKDMKSKAADDVLSEILTYREREGIIPICPSSKQTLVDKSELERSNQVRIDGGNKGHQLLMKMGWKGEGGLGKGKADPITVIEPLKQKQGLGGPSSSLSRNEIRSRLNKFLSNNDETMLRFPAGLSSEDRKLIHTLSGQYNLLHKSHGKDNERYTIVTKRIDYDSTNEETA